MKPTLLPTILFTALFSSVSLTSYAWSEYLDIYNNTNTSLHYSVSTVGSSGISPKTAVIPPYSKINVEVRDGKLSFLKRWQSEGTISLSSENTNPVNVHYHGWANYHALELKNQTQHSDATVQLITNSRKMCDGPMNCIIVSPNMDWVKSTLQLQDAIDQYEPLNNEQQISTHNSYISSAYGKTYGVDPNQSMKISEQLDAGVMALELDLHYVMLRHDILLCHGHPRLGKNGPAIGCAPTDNLLKTGLQEIRQWLEKKIKTAPNTFITLYLDESLMGHLKEADALFENELGEYIFSREDLKNYFNHRGMDPKNLEVLPVNQLTKNDVLAAKKHILIVTKGSGFENSRFVFDRTTKEGITLPYDHGIMPISPSMTGANVFNKDNQHISLWRILEDQTKLSDDKNYVTVFNIPQIMPWRVNWISMDKITKNDSRLASFLWSWDKNFPLPLSVENAKPYAVLITQRERFQNTVDVAKESIGVLCHDQTQSIKSNWVVSNPVNITVEDRVDAANQVCQKTFGPMYQFATPVNSYSMIEAVKAAKDANVDKVLVNNIFEDGQWVANQKHSLTS